MWNYKSLSMVAATALAVSTISTSAMAEDNLIVAIYKSGTQQYFIDQAAGFTAAAEELGYEARIINVQTDANLAVSAISDAIAVAVFRQAASSVTSSG